MNLNFEINDYIETYKGSNNTIGIAIIQFKDKNEMLDMINNMDKYIKIIVEEKE